MSKTYTITEQQLYTMLNRTYKASSLDHYSDLSQRDYDELKSRFKDILNNSTQEVA
jgi:hypothetical protein